jgi:hypothetical protein
LNLSWNQALAAGFLFCADASTMRGMRSVFIAFIITATLLLVATGTLGAMVEGGRWFDHHFALGLVATLFICLGHCVVFTYFMATSKMIRMAVEDAGLESKLFEQARCLKLRAYRALMVGIAMALAAAFTGAWVSQRSDAASLHLAAALASSATQLAVWYLEFMAVVENGRLMDLVFERHAEVKGDPDGLSRTQRSTS